MSPWLLLAFLLAVWLVWIVACATQAALADALRDIPEGQRRGVSILPGFPLFPLAFWGAALLIDRFVSPWGTLFIGGAHVILAVLWSVSIYRSRKRLVGIGDAA